MSVSSKALPDAATAELSRLDSAAWQQMLDLQSNGILWLDSELRIVLANSAARGISRILPEHIGQYLFDLYPETAGTIAETAYRSVLATGVPECLPDFYYAPFDLWVRISVMPFQQGILINYLDVSRERHLAEDRRASEDRLAFALQSANGVGVWDWDIINDRVYSDARFATMYGVTPELAAAGTPMADFVRNIHPDDLEATTAEIMQSIRTGADFYSEYRLIQPDGSVRWVAARGRPLLNAQGSATRFPGVTIDITEQKERDELLRVSEARYRALTELSPQSQWTANAEGLVLYANQRFLEYIGYDFVPKTGTEYIACFDERDRERVVEVWTRSVVTGEDYHLEARLLRASDGASRWWELRAVPIRDEHGAIEQWLGTATDIHEKRLAEDKLRDQYAEIDRRKRELETIYDGSPIGMALYDPKELRLLRLNPRQAQILGLNTEAAIGLTIGEITPGSEHIHDLLRRAAAGETIHNHTVEATLPSQPGALRHFNINYSPIFAEDGTVLAVAGATIEVTQQKRAEVALIQSEKLAAVGRMASSIAHEINNPLEAVTNLVYLARAHAILPEVQTYLDTAEQELRRVSIIANQTLRFHKQATRPTEVRAFDLFHGVLSLYEGRLRNSNIRVEISDRQTLPIACFEGDIRQVLNNLVGNAIDAMPHGGRLLVRSREATDWRTGRHGLALTIADTGSGIAPDSRAHLFEAFYTTKGFNGTGLGLWISSEIIERHQGRILVSSSQHSDHCGTVFTVFLPSRAVPEAL